MKKLTLALLSVLAFGSAAAAQDSVTVYGRIDLGVGISRINDGFGSKRTMLRWLPAPVRPIVSVSKEKKI